MALGKMFRSKTTFIVGAGASHEVGLPVGSGLKAMIRNILSIEVMPSGQLNGDHRIIASLMHILRDNKDLMSMADLVGLCRRISENMFLASSIDNYLDAHRDDVILSKIAKFAITISIIDAEKNSHLMENSSGFSEEKVSETWYYEFFNMLVRNVPLTEVESIFDNVSIITFNYDRCIEHFLYKSLKKWYSLNDDRVVQLLNNLRILHPYGRVGGLPWQESGPVVEYGDSSFDNVHIISDSIITFSERISDEKYLFEIKECVANCHTLVFLGSAFHENNMDILKSNSQTQINRIFGTAYGTSDYDVDLIRKSLKEISSPYLIKHSFASTITIDPHNRCADFLRGLNRTLTS